MTTRGPGRRRWAIGLAAAAGVLAALVLLLPAALGTRAARGWLLSRANRAMAPAGFRAGAIRFSWFGPTRISDFTILDSEGDRVVTAPSATWDRNLWQALFERPKLGTLTLDRAGLDVERREDGTIDLVEAIKPILSRDPRTDLHIRVRDGRIRIGAAGQRLPVSSGRVELTIDVPAAPGLASWTARLEDGDPARTSSLEVRGKFDRAGALAGRRADLSLKLEGRRWPLMLSVAGIEASGRFGGRIEVYREAGRWLSRSQATLEELFLAGPRLGGDHLRLDRARGTWNVSAEPTRDGTRLVGRLDLNASFPSAGKDRDEWPVGITLKANVPAGSRGLDIDQFTLASRFATLEGTGRVGDIGGRRRADLRGTLSPDWKALNALLVERTEPQARVAGKSSAWRLRAPLDVDSASALRESLDAELGFELTGADIYGLHLGPAPVVFRSRGGKLALAPIDTTLNGGKVHLEPTLRLDGDAGPSLRFGPASTITDAEINDEVSHRVLSFVAPVLDRATRAHGRVSVRLKEAVLPLARSSKAGTSVVGDVVFQQVEFVPGPLVDQLFDLIGREDRSALKLDNPVSLTIADRRVTQHGLALPLGDLTQVEIDGSVDFDRNLDLTASVPLTPAMVGNRPLLGSIVSGTKIRVPIRGSLRQPKIDRDAFNLALKDLGKSLLERGAIQGAAELLMRLGRGRDPNAPPPLTREERRERRMERREQRRRERGLEP